MTNRPHPRHPHDDDDDCDHQLLQLDGSRQQQKLSRFMSPTRNSCAAYQRLLVLLLSMLLIAFPIKAEQEAAARMITPFSPDQPYQQLVDHDAVTSKGGGGPQSHLRVVTLTATTRTTAVELAVTTENTSGNEHDYKSKRTKKDRHRIKGSSYRTITVSAATVSNARSNDRLLKKSKGGKKDKRNGKEKKKKDKKKKKEADDDYYKDDDDNDDDSNDDDKEDADKKDADNDSSISNMMIPPSMAPSMHSLSIASSTPSTSNSSLNTTSSASDDEGVTVLAELVPFTITFNNDNYVYENELRTALIDYLSTTMMIATTKHNNRNNNHSNNDTISIDLVGYTNDTETTTATTITNNVTYYGTLYTAAATKNKHSIHRRNNIASTAQTKKDRSANDHNTNSNSSSSNVWIMKQVLALKDISSLIDSLSRYNWTVPPPTSTSTSASTIQFDKIDVTVEDDNDYSLMLDGSNNDNDYGNTNSSSSDTIHDVDENNEQQQTQHKDKPSNDSKNTSNHNSHNEEMEQAEKEQEEMNKKKEATQSSSLLQSKSFLYILIAGIVFIVLLILVGFIIYYNQERSYREFEKKQMDLDFDQLRLPGDSSDGHKEYTDNEQIMILFENEKELSDIDRTLYENSQQHPMLLCFTSLSSSSSNKVKARTTPFNDPIENATTTMTNDNNSKNNESFGYHSSNIDDDDDEYVTYKTPASYSIKRLNCLSSLSSSNHTHTNNSTATPTNKNNSNGNISNSNTEGDVITIKDSKSYQNWEGLVSDSSCCSGKSWNSCSSKSTTNGSRSNVNDSDDSSTASDEDTDTDDEDPIENSDDNCIDNDDEENDSSNSSITDLTNTNLYDSNHTNFYKYFDHAKIDTRDESILDDNGSAISSIPAMM